MRFGIRTKSVVLFIAGFLAFFANAALAQEIVIPRAEDLQASDCSPELFASVDRDYGMRPFRGSDYRAEKYIRRILEVCPSSKGDPILKSELETLEEELAEHSYSIATYYLNQAEKGKTGLKGAQSRFLEILEKYPQYTKIDQVLVLAARTYEIENNGESYFGGVERLQQLIQQFPSSPSRTAVETVIQELKTREMIEKVKEGR